MFISIHLWQKLIIGPVTICIPNASGLFTSMLSTEKTTETSNGSRKKLLFGHR
ncbi:hypothetical protein RB3568 [Rhodopirellula baltica SH 1]|uniref:Uncharacterized protein n=1 Tax=Rhodopirellula baltica (strain DSM 10527 / NCIMB 13988 / SH1) TaxID=243090 RepID=Q7UU17_RHOBA|nr:hypothetical protein RB3568 [Rhodopirellula baltica SH 1]